MDFGYFLNLEIFYVKVTLTKIMFKSEWLLSCGTSGLPYISACETWTGPW